MEDQQTKKTIEIKPRMRYTVYSTVRKVEEVFETYYEDPSTDELVKNLIKGKGPSLGWFVQFDGSYEALHFGKEKPEFKVGARIKITFEEAADGPSKV